MIRHLALCALAALCISAFFTLPTKAAENVEVEVYGNSQTFKDGKFIVTSQFFKIRVGTPSFTLDTSEKIILTKCFGQYIANGRQWIQDDENVWRLIEYNVEVDKTFVFSPQACFSMKPKESFKTSADLPPLLQTLNSALLKKVHYFIEFYSGAFFIYLYDEKSPETANILAKVFRESSVQ